jgi:hypothetical protein
MKIQPRGLLVSLVKLFIHRKTNFIFIIFHLICSFGPHSDGKVRINYAKLDLTQPQ